MGNKKNETIKKIRDASNTLVYLWKREYNKCLKENKPFPKPISIPQIAHKALLAPKTIYTTEEYKEIALTAIAKTTLNIDNDLGIEMMNKDTYTVNEVRNLVKKINNEYQIEREKLLNIIVKLSKEAESLKSEHESKESIVIRQIKNIADLEYENSQLKGMLSTISK